MVKHIKEVLSERGRTMGTAISTPEAFQKMEHVVSQLDLMYKRIGSMEDRNVLKNVITQLKEVKEKWMQPMVKNR